MELAYLATWDTNKIFTMKKPLKAYCVSGKSLCTNWLPTTAAFEIKTADIVVFPGGSDINPDLYGARKHPATSYMPELDEEQLEDYREAVKHKKRMVGICRGGQLLCAMAGGQLVQNQRDSSSRHTVFTYDGRIIEVTSSHHQAMYPWYMPKENYKVLGWSFGQSDKHEDGEMREMVIGKAPLDMEVEIAYFKGINALCLQPHPEWQWPARHSVEADYVAIEYYLNLFERFMDGDKFEDAHKSFESESTNLALSK